MSKRALEEIQTKNFSLRHGLLNRIARLSRVYRTSLACLHESYRREAGLGEDSQGLGFRGLREELTVRWAREVLAHLRVDLRVYGKATQAPCFLVGNHLSYLDIPVLLSEAHAVLVAKNQIKYWPVFGACARRTETVFVDRSSPASRQAVAAQLAGVVWDRKQTIALFPSGTTSIGETKPWKHGAFKIAHRYEIPVQPFRIRYRPERECAFIDRDFFPVHFWRLGRLERIEAELEFADPVRVTDPVNQCQEWWRWSQFSAG